MSERTESSHLSIVTFEHEDGFWRSYAQTSEGVDRETRDESLFAISRELDILAAKARVAIRQAICVCLRCGRSGLVTKMKGYSSHYAGMRGYICDPDCGAGL